MSSSVLTALLAIVAVAVVAIVMRSSQSSEVVLPPPATPERDEPDETHDGDEPEEGWEEGDAAAVSSDGLAFIGEDHGVRLVPIGEGMQGPSAAAPAVGDRWSAGDFTAARIMRGAPSVDPWRLELLGRDGEFMPFAFETEDGAKCALALLESRGVVRAALDDDGNPISTPREQFEEARRWHEETERELAMMHDEDPPKD